MPLLIWRSTDLDREEYWKLRGLRSMNITSKAVFASVLTLMFLYYVAFFICLNPNPNLYPNPSPNLYLASPICYLWFFEVREILQKLTLFWSNMNVSYDAETCKLLHREIHEKLSRSCQQNVLFDSNFLCYKWEIQCEWIRRTLCLLVGSPGKEHPPETRRPHRRCYISNMSSKVEHDCFNSPRQWQNN